jgi:hypothetical protein
LSLDANPYSFLFYVQLSGSYFMELVCIYHVWLTCLLIR